MTTSNWYHFKAKTRRFLKPIAILSVAIGTAIAASTFIPDDQPWGYVAEPAVNTQRLQDGDAVAYVPWFESGSMRGDILALPISTTGSVGFVPNWHASLMLDSQDFNTGRRIATTDGSGVGVPFRYDNLSGDQQTSLDPDPAEARNILNYVRGDRSLEGTSFRARNSVMGSVVHSSPEYVGKPNRAYDFDNYATYYTSNESRPGRVYASANDGMVHAFDAATGTELYAYVPSMIIDKLHRISETTASHRYLVDGHLTAEDAQIGGAWHTVLVGGLGAGGKGLFVLDVTDPDAANENEAAAKILWEFHAGSAGAANLGYTYGRPSVVRLSSSQWAVVVSNGYLSDSGAASLYILDLGTGAVLNEIVVPDMAANGLSSPTVVDVDGDGFAETAYAGDRNGNLWKFDLQSGTVEYGAPLFAAGASQPITIAPEVGPHPEGGIMVYVGTGELMTLEDSEDLSTQAIYGIWDNGSPVSIGQLVNNRLKDVIHDTGIITRVVSNNQPDWDTHRGWVVPALVLDASIAETGERVLQEMSLRNGRLSLTLINPTISTGENWLIMLGALNGGAPHEVILDINEDNVLDVFDNSDGNGDGVVTNIAADRVVGQYQEFGLASRPLIVRQDETKDSLLINHLAAIPPTGLPPILPEDPELPPDVVIDPGDRGVYGGHFDLDTSSQWYSFDSGATDGHVHEWDDKWNRTTVDLFDLPDDGKLFPISDIVAGDTPFMLTVGNTALSSAAVLEVNGVTISALEYHDLQNRYLSDTLKSDEKFPIYMLNTPSGAASAAGIKQLTSLKVTFSAYAIVTGGLIPTNTGCVRNNEQGALGEYRNGAFIVQALDASGVESGFLYSTVDDEFVAQSGPTSVHGEHGHATSDTVLYESSLFWHWDGVCYNEPDWDSQYLACVTDAGCFSADLSDDGDGKTKTKDKDKDDGDSDPDSGTEPPSTGGDGGSGTPAEETDPDHNLSETTILGGDPQIGRLFWREIVPE